MHTQSSRKVLPSNQRVKADVSRRCASENAAYPFSLDPKRHMGRVGLQLFLFFLTISLSSCAYLRNRGNDLVDVVTLSGERNYYGAAVQAGPTIGLSFGGGKGYGLRSGVRGAYEYGEGNILLLGFKGLEIEPTRDLRNKSYIHGSYKDVFGDGKFKNSDKFNEGSKVSWYQLEVAAGLYFGIRAGINLGELADFLCGLTTFDFLKDDVR